MLVVLTLFIVETGVMYAVEISLRGYISIRISTDNYYLPSDGFVLVDR